MPKKKVIFPAKKKGGLALAGGGSQGETRAIPRLTCSAKEGTFWVEVLSRKRTHNVLAPGKKGISAGFRRGKKKARQVCRYRRENSRLEIGLGRCSF